jgi:hypothetical protein
MVVMTPRENWTDARLDDLKEHMDAGFAELKAELRQQRGEMGQQRGEMAAMARQKDMEARFDDLARTIQIVFGVLGAVLTANTAMLVGLLGWIVTQQ